MRKLLCLVVACALCAGCATGRCALSASTVIDDVEYRFVYSLGNQPLTAPERGAGEHRP